jgi:cell shape-determining protein MreC
MRYRGHRRLDRKSTLFVLLMGISVAALLVPARITAPLISLVQVLTPFQDFTQRAADAVGEAVEGPAPPAIDADEYDALRTRSQSYQNMIASLSLRVRALEQERDDLAGLRKLGLDSTGQLIPARVISSDMLSWHRAKLVDAGSLRGVRAGAAVTSNEFSVAAGTSQGMRNGLRVLAGEVLVGTVVQVGTHQSRVQWLTDPATKMPVVIGHPSQNGLEPLDAEFWMVGMERRGLQIRDVDHGYVERHEVQTGDLVMSLSDDERLPISVMIGTVSAIHPDPDNALLYVLEVTPAVDLDRLRRVYAVDLRPPALAE